MKHAAGLAFIQLAVGALAFAAGATSDGWGTDPLGPRIEPAPFRPAPIKQPLRPTLTVAPASGPAIVLVQDGTPAGLVVLASKPSVAAREAAVALQETLRKMTGAEVPIAKEAELTVTKQGGRWSVVHRGRAVPYVVALGATQLAASERLSGDELPHEGYRIKTVGNVLFLVGSDVRREGSLALDGTRHAVSALLERHLGCRWLWPGELGEVVPKRSTVMIPALDETDAPAIRQRKIRNYAYGSVVREGEKRVLRHERVGVGMKALGLTSDDYVEWCAQSIAWWSQQRLGSSYAVEAGHAYNGWWNRFGAGHPEWFALQRNGSRMPGRLPAEREKLCHSNPELIARVVGEKIAELQRNPGRDSVSVSPNDGGGNNSACLCAACRRLDPVNGRPATMDTYVDGKRVMIPYVSQSDRMFTYYNRVAEGVAAVLPDRLLGTYAYSNYRDLPLGVRPHPNLLVGFVGLGYWEDQAREDDRRRWEQWAGAAKNLFLRPNAFHQGHAMPGVFVRKLDRDIKRCYETGMIAADFDSIIHHWAAQGLNYYVLAKLLWDPSRDAEAIVADYCEQGFGPAAGAMRRYFRELEEVTDRCAAGDSPENAGPQGELRAEEEEAGGRHAATYARLARTYTPAAIGRLRQILNDARAAAGSDARVRERIDFLDTGLRYGELQAAVHGAMLAKPLDQARLLPLLDERHAAFRDLVRRHPFAINVAFIAWREGSMWARTGWRPAHAR